MGFTKRLLEQMDEDSARGYLIPEKGERFLCANHLAHAENGNRVLPYKYLYRHLDGLGLKAVIVRPGLIDWNAISRKHTLDQLLEEIGEPVYRYQRKESAQEGF